MERFPTSPHLRKWLAASSLLVAFGLSALADTVYVTTFDSSGNETCPPEFTKNPLGLSGVTISGSCGSSANGTTAIASPPGVPTRPKATFGSAGTCNWSIQNPTPMAEPGAVYTIEVGHTAASASTSVLVTAYSSDGTVSASCTNSAVFQASFGGNNWNLMGYITNNPGVTQPTITFVMTGGAALSTTSRLYIDCFKLTAVDPCFGIGAVTVTGPLVAGQTTVNVSGVTAGVTNIVVFANSVQIGSATSAGFAAGTVAVTCSALVGGQSVTAEQLKGSCNGGLSSAVPVGSGPNSTIQVALELGKSNTLTGPIGAPSGPNSYAYWDHASGRRTFSFGAAPSGGYVITPSTNWVTLTFNSDTDTAAGNTYDWQANVAPYTNADNFAVLEGLALAIDDTTPDIGPYRVYIDSIYNGTNLIQGFEATPSGTSYANNTYGVMFLRPTASGTTTAWLTSPPDTNYINNTAGLNADTGTNSFGVEWVFKDTSINNWVRLYTGGSGTPYPQVDLHQPITVRMLVLPVGQSLGRRFDGNVSFLTNSLNGFWTGGSNTLGATVAGTGTYTYQWSYNGNPIGGATDPAYTLQPFSGITANDEGLYSLAVTDEGGGTIVRSVNVHSVVDPVPTITNAPVDRVAQASTAVTFTVGADGHVPNGYPLSYQWYFNGNGVGANSSALVIPSASSGDVGSYSVVVSNTYGAVTSGVAMLAVTSVAPGTGTGLRGDYYTLHTNGVNNFAGAPTLTRTDPTVFFDWGTGSPAPSISSDYFMVRWSGQVQAMGNDTYTFSTVSDDGARLWVNDQQVISNWTLHGPTTNSAAVALTGNQKYDIMMEYYENQVGAVAKLLWSSASGSIPTMIIPQSQLYPAASQVIPTVGTSVSGTNLVLTWAQGSYTLVASPTVNGTYTNVAVGVTNPVSIPIGPTPQMFYRLKVQ